MDRDDCTRYELTIILFKTVGILLASDLGACDGEALRHFGISKIGANCQGRFTYGTLRVMGQNSCTFTGKLLSECVNELQG